MDHNEIPASIVELLYSLPEEPGFQVGMDQILKVQCLLASMAAQGALPQDTQRICYLIAPVVCTSPAEQRDFYRLFDERVLAIERRAIIRPDVRPNPNRVLTREKWRNRRIGLASILVLSVGVYWLFRLDNGANTDKYIVVGPKAPANTPVVAVPESEKKELAQVVVVPAKDSAQTLSSSELIVVAGDVPPEPLSRAFVVAGYSVFALIGGFMLWALWIWKLRRATVFLHRQSTTQKPSIIASAKLNSMASELFGSADVSAVARQIRQRTTIASTRLDVENTVEFTARQSGTFSPRFGTRSISPEYLVLVERHSRRDHMAHFVEAFLGRLKDEEVHIDRYWYVGDPRFCQSVEYERPFPLDVLITRHADARLVVCGRAETFFDRFTGRPADWTQALEHWDHRVLLTSTPVTEWGNPEWHLAHTGVVVLPLTLEGISEMATRFAPRVESASVPVSFAPRLPRFVTDNEEAWLTAFAPKEEIICRLLDELSCFLGRKGMLWFSACAVYPELNWDLTLLLGQRLAPDLFTESNIASISRLPWFRVGWAPDWLRERLIANLTNEQVERVRFEIDTVLFHAIRGESAEGDKLEIAWDNRHWLAAIGDRISRRLRTADADNPEAHDYVFAKFVETERASNVAYRVSNRIVQLLKRRMKPRVKRSLLGQIARPIVGLGLITAGVVFGLLAFKPSDTRITLPTRFDNTVALPGYGPDLKTAIDQAITDLQSARVEQFVRNMLPTRELGFLVAQGNLPQVVAQIETGLSTEGGRLKPPIVADLEAIQSFLVSGGQPIRNEEKTVASFVIQRRIRASGAPPAAPIEFPPVNNKPADERKPVDEKKEESKSESKAEFNPRESRSRIILTRFRPQNAQSPTPNQANPNPIDGNNAVQDNGAPPAAKVVPQTTQLPDQYAVTCRFQLVDGSWRFFDSADQLRRVQSVLIRQSGVTTTWDP